MKWGRTSRVDPEPRLIVSERVLDRAPAIGLGRAFLWLRHTLTMSTWKKTIKGLMIAGVCGVGLCALAKRLKLSDRLADFAQNVEGVPFPGGRMYSLLASRQLRPLYREVADDIAASGIEGRVLDLGTDLGYIPIELAKSKPSLTAVGLDTSGDMVQIAQANARTEGVNGKPEFGVGDPTHLPFPGRYFDLVVSVSVLRHWTDTRSVFEEVYHVLNPGGEFWIFDYRKDIPDELLQEITDRLPGHQRMLFQLGPAASARSALGEQEIAELAQETRFEMLSVEDKSLTIFREHMPLFVKIRLQKPQIVREQ